MASTHKKVRYLPKPEGDIAPHDASREAEDVLKVIEGRWKLRILFHLNAGGVMRFSELERAIPAVTQKMLIQQLRELEHDELVERRVHPEIPPKVDYQLTAWGLELCPALIALRKWAAQKAGKRTVRRSTQKTPGPPRRK